MNEKVRTYLIEVARQRNKFVYYSDVVKDCELGFDLKTEFGQHQLSVALGEVSEFEDAHNRPLISSLVIYKDPSKNDQGDGFYALAAKLRKGKFKELKEVLYGFKEAGKCRIYWQNDNNYQQYAFLSTNTPVADKVSFFTQPELDFFKEWQSKPYDPENDEHLEAKKYLMDTVWEKSIHLGKEIVKRLIGFELEGKKYWSQRGWKENKNGENVQAAIFKSYTWVKVFRNTDKGRDIFFTFGLDAHQDVEAFVFKIDCQDKRDSKLSQHQIDLCKSLIPDTTKWNEISFEELIHENWESLINICVKFIKTHLAQYDAIISAVWGGPIPPTLFQNKLIKKGKPRDGFEIMPESKREFKEVDIDYQTKAQEQKDLGDLGERLVKQREIEFLTQRGFHEKAALVEIVKDGKGYDVLSFDETGNEKYIEVKTTKGNEYASFYLSDNEVAFMRLNLNQYFIYRLYNYNEENNFAEFFELSGNVESQILMKPVNYQVLIKKEN